MKKTLSAALSTTLILGFAGTALAAETSTVVAKKDVEITLDGSIRSRGYMQQDFTKDNSNITGYDSKVTLGVAAKSGDAIKGYVKLETGDGKDDNYNWGYDDNTGLNNGGWKGQGETTDLAILEAWLDWNPNKFGLKVGHQRLALGNKLFFDHTGSGDDAIVVYMDPTDKTHIGFLTIKFIEDSNTTNADDLNGYVALLKQKLGGGSSLGVNLTHLNGYVDTLTEDLSMYNLGVDYTGKFGNFTLTGDLEFQFGDLDDTTSQEGFAAMVDGKFNIGRGYVGALIGYGSGDDGSDPTTNENFINFLTDTRYHTTIISYRYAVPGQATKNTDLANLMLLQLYGGLKGVCPITKKDLSLLARVSMAELNEEVVAGGDTDLGVEIEAILKWKLTSGLTYGLELAYLIAGDAWGTDLDDPYFIRHGLEFKF